MRKSFLLPLVFISLFANSQTPNLVKDIYPGIKSSFFESPMTISVTLNPINNGVIFNATSNGTKHQLWYSDGSNAGTYELNPNISTGSPNINTANYFNGKYYFAAATASAGTEMYMTDGTTAGTQILKDIVSGPGSGWGRILNITTSKIYFIANDGVTGNEIYVSDGTTIGTGFLKDMVPGAASPTVSYYNNINTIGNNFYFISTTATEGTELWFTDGTTSGTKMVSDIWPGTGNSISTITFKYLRGNSNDLFFTANNGVNGEELWFSNGTTATLLKDIRPGSTGTIIDYLKFENNILFFMADDGTNGKELWRSDGTTAGTYLLHDLNPGSGSSNVLLNNLNNKVYYYNPPSNKLWESDGTTAGTFSVNIPCAATTTLNYSNSEIFKFSNTLYFNVHRFTNTSNNDSIFFYKLTSGLGSMANFAVFKNETTLPSVCNSGYFDSISVNQFRYVYSAYGSSSGNHISFISGGTSLNTYSCGATTIQMNSGSCKEHNLLEVNNNLVFYGSQTLLTGPVGMFSNSLVNGNAQLLSSSIAPAPTSGSSDLIPFAKHNNLIYFRGQSSGTGTELYVTDGTPSGTSLVLDIFPGTNSAINIESTYITVFEDNFVAVSSGGKFFFLANNGVTGTELWSIGSSTGIKENNINTSFSMFPNPTKDVVNLNLKEQFIGGNIQLFDAIGKLIQTQSIKNTTEKIDLNLNSGIYFIKATTREGVSKTEKLIIE